MGPHRQCYRAVPDFPGGGGVDRGQWLVLQVLKIGEICQGLVWLVVIAISYI